MAEAKGMYKLSKNFSFSAKNKKDAKKEAAKAALAGSLNIFYD
jgi:hypothetical protein